MQLYGSSSFGLKQQPRMCQGEVETQERESDCDTGTRADEILKLNQKRNVMNLTENTCVSTRDWMYCGVLCCFLRCCSSCRSPVTAAVDIFVLGYRNFELEKLRSWGFPPSGFQCNDCFKGRNLFSRHYIPSLRAEKEVSFYGAQNHGR